MSSLSTLYLTKPSVAKDIIMQLKRILSSLGVTAILGFQVIVIERGFGDPESSA